MRILVTGAAGFIGSHLTDRLLARGDEVVGLDAFDDYYDPAVKRRNLRAATDHDGFRLVKGDIRDAGAWASLPDVDAVVHLAARPGVRASIEDPVLCQQVNVGGTQRMLEHCRERGIERVVFGSSSSSVYGNTDQVPFTEDQKVDRPISPYAASKVAGEVLCHTYHHLFDIGVAALRFFTVYGPRQRPDLAIHKFTRRLLDGEPIPRYGDGSSERDYTYIDDILDGVEAALAWLDTGRPRYAVANLGSGRTIRLSAMIELIGEAAGAEPEIEELPEQPGDVDRTYADISRARELFGYEPETSFREGLEEFVAWYREVEA